MHELGHNLGLLHGGNEPTLNKPNYLSVMNYTFQLTGLIPWAGNQAVMDYSRRQLNPLNEALLDESVGIGEPAFVTFWKCPPHNTYLDFFPPGTLDWNLDGLINPGTVAAELNCDGAMTILTGAEDWSALRFDGEGMIGNSAGVDLVDRMNTEAGEGSIDEVLANVPPEVANAESVAPLDVATVTIEGGPGSLTATFDGTGSTAVTGTIVSWVWDFGDGTTGSGAVFQHTYAFPGEYYATLTVTDSNGNVNRIPVLIYVSIGSPTSPTPTPTPIPGPGDIDPTFKATVTTTYGRPVYAVATQADGKTIVGGDFESFGGYARRNIARLNADGTCDPTFDPGLIFTDVFDSPSNLGAINRVGLSVQAIAVQTDGKILVGVQGSRGFKDGISAASRMIVRLNTNGTLDPSFDATGFDLNFSTPQVSAIALQSDGKIIVGGAFLYENNGTITAIARLNTDGSLDFSFRLPEANPFGGPNFSAGVNAGAVYTIAVQPDGKVIIGGSFEYVGLTPRAAIARLNSDGSLDLSYNDQNSSNLSKFSGPSALALQADGKVIVAGYLTPDGSAPFPFLQTERRWEPRLHLFKHVWRKQSWL